MKLHENQQRFGQIVISAANYYKVPRAIIEKDYYVTLILREMAAMLPGLIFKGGTSLSKCYHIIERFSEDLDLTLDAEHRTQGQKRNIKAAILYICDKYKMSVLNLEEIKSRRDFNRYVIEYAPAYKTGEVRQELLVETAFMQNSYPTQEKTANSLIYDFLQSSQFADIAEEYELKPFTLAVQAPERTLADKVFALCDYMLEGRTERQSRHIYDISRLLTIVPLNEELKALVNRVRKERRGGVKALSAEEGVDIPALLKKMTEEEMFKSDYNRVTMLLLRTPVPYEQAIKALCAIIESGVFSE